MFPALCLQRLWLPCCRRLLLSWERTSPSQRMQQQRSRLLGQAVQWQSLLPMGWSAL